MYLHIGTIVVLCTCYRGIPPQLVIPLSTDTLICAVTGTRDAAIHEYAVHEMLACRVSSPSSTTYALLATCSSPTSSSTRVS